MKYLLAFLLLISQCGYSQIIPKDKQLHFAAGMGITPYGMVLVKDKGFNQELVGLGLTSVFAVGKEVYDKTKGGAFDIKDIGATMAGGVVSAGITKGIKALKHKRHNKRYDRLSTYNSNRKLD